MPLDSYAGLQAEVGEWLDRGDLPARIPTFIAMAEASLNRVVRHRRMTTRLPITLDGESTTLPADFVSVRAVAVDTALGPRLLRFMTIDEMLLHRGPGGGTPERFSIEGGTLVWLPNAVPAVSGRLVYYSRIPALTAANPTNWLLASQPDVYLYATLLESAPFLRDDERLPVWRALLDGKLAELARDGQASDYTDGPIQASAPAFG